MKALEIEDGETARSVSHEIIRAMRSLMVVLQD